MSLLLYAYGIICVCNNITMQYFGSDNRYNMVDYSVRCEVTHDW